MYVGLKQPRGDGEPYVTPARAAAKETRATLVGGKSSHHCAISALQNESKPFLSSYKENYQPAFYRYHCLNTALRCQLLSYFQPWSSETPEDSYALRYQLREPNKSITTRDEYYVSPYNDHTMKGRKVKRIEENHQLGGYASLQVWRSTQIDIPKSN